MSQGRPRRKGRQSLAWQAEEYDEDEQQHDADEEDEQEAPRRRHRAGKAPVDDDEAYEPGYGDEDEEEQQPRRLAGSRRGHAGDVDAGPSAKRGRRSSQPAQPVVKAEPGTGNGAGPSRRQGAAEAAAGGPARATNAQLRAVDDKIAEYRRLKDSAFEKAQGKASNMAMSQAARAVVRHMLFSHAEKPGVPVKRSELSTLVASQLTQNIKSKTAVIAYVLAHAQHYLVESMGLEMRSMAQLRVRGRDAAHGGEEGSQQYVLRSIVPPALRAAFVLDSRQDAQRGLLMVVLALIHLAGGKLEEGELYEQLAELGMSKDEPHPVFGSLPAQLKQYCSRRYIQAEKQQGGDGEEIMYHLAEQATGADAEIGEEAIKEFIKEQFAATAAEEQDGGGGAEDGSA